MVRSSVLRFAIVYTAVMAIFGMGRVVTLGDEACCSKGDWPLVAKIRAACQSVAGRQPYRPFADHYPRFHPVPVSPVFPSLYDTASAAGTSVPAGEQPARTLPPKLVPRPIPTTPQEAAPLPSPNSGDKTHGGNHVVPRQASRPATGISWIFLPAAPPASQEASPSQQGSKVADRVQRVVR